MPRIVGVARAKELLLTGRIVSAAEGERIGLVHEVVPAAELAAAADRVVAEILSAGPEAARHAKRLVLDAPLDGLETARRIAERRGSDEGQEGLRAFLERRPPGWSA